MLRGICSLMLDFSPLNSENQTGSSFLLVFAYTMQEPHSDPNCCRERSLTPCRHFSQLLTCKQHVNAKQNFRAWCAEKKQEQYQGCCRCGTAPRCGELFCDRITMSCGVLSFISTYDGAVRTVARFLLRYVFFYFLPHITHRANLDLGGGAS